MKKVIIEGMQCRNCANMVEEALCRLENTEEVRVSLEEGYFEIIGRVSDEEITDLIRDMGYKVVAIEQE